MAGGRTLFNEDHHVHGAAQASDGIQEALRDPDYWQVQ